MVTIRENIYPKAAQTSSATPQEKSTNSAQTLSSHETLMNQLKMANSDNFINSVTNSLDITMGDNDLISDMPLLVSDNEVSDDDTYSLLSFTNQRTLKREANITEPAGPGLGSGSGSSSVLVSPESPSGSDETDHGVTNITSSSNALVQTQNPATGSLKPSPLQTVTSKTSQLSPSQFKLQRNQLMGIIVKYIATKIHNSFPPESPRLVKSDEIPLDKFLLILTSRLQLTIPMFMKGIIYLFRYMDIIYLLRYLNQSNNFANYNSMDFELKKLLVGCFKLAILREQKLNVKRTENKTAPNNPNWSTITGLSSHEINTVVKKIISRMNGKLNIKNIELVRLKSEIFRFVKMVSNEV